MTSMTNSAVQDELNQMLLFLLAFAQQTLREEGAFYPFGAGMTPEGEMTAVAADADDRESTPADALAALHTGLVEQAAAGEINVAGVCMDVRVVPPGATSQSDAICVELQHREGEAVDIFLPYKVSDGEEVEYGTLFATPGEQTIFLPIAS